jgi:hypothetical protein
MIDPLIHKVWERMRFLAAVYKYKAQSYEDLFTFVMRHRFPDFRPVRPVGSVGDRKNDGFISTSGTYFQVFAPEDLERVDKKGAQKVRGDFIGLRTHWNDVNRIREYRFVVNDRYQGLGPETTQAIEQLKIEFPDVTFGSFLCHELENEFILLDPDVQIELFGGSCRPWERAAWRPGYAPRSQLSAFGVDYRDNANRVPPNAPLENASSTPGYTRHYNPAAAELPGMNDLRLTLK